MDDLRRYAAMFAALGQEARLAIVRLLLSAHPHGLVAGEIQRELDIPPSTLSHHLDSLRQQGLVEQVREGKYLRYAASAQGLKALLDFLYEECCSRSDLVPSESIGDRWKECTPCPSRSRSTSPSTPPPSRSPSPSTRRSSARRR